MPLGSSPHSHAPTAVLLMGPTAAGKTDLAIELVRRLPLEIISVDSAMVYRGLDIGTAKPSIEVLKTVPHHLIDILPADKPYSCAQFREDALTCMREISRRGKIPLLVGGTMLYFRSLQQGISAIPAIDPAVRAYLTDEAGRLGLQAMHNRLARIDPEAAKGIHPNDPQRIVRALEVFESTGQPLSSYWKQVAPQPEWHWQSFIVAHQDKAKRNELIERRFQRMLAQGLIEEVEALAHTLHLQAEMPSMRAVGYRQVWQYLQGDYSYETMIQKAVVATRQLAKRQMTWLRGNHLGIWFAAEQSHLAESLRLALEPILAN